MHNFERLVEQTDDGKRYLMAAPVIDDVANGRFDLETYRAFLTNAYHHVKHTVPLLMATAARIPLQRTELVGAVKTYIDEEYGHEQWVLDDLEACGSDRARIVASRANLETDVMVAYVRDYIEHVDPVGFFGMVHVLEGTSVSLATATADLVQSALDLPDAAFTYLRSHGDLDVGHVDFFRDLVDSLSDQEVEHVIFVAGRVYRLYGNVLRSIPRQETHDAA